MMPPSDSPDASDKSSPVRYNTDGFKRSLRHLLDAEQENDGTGRILFHGGTRERRQQALATVTRHTTANVHQFRVSSLLTERRMQTQNNLRKAFDHGAEESALLYFDSADALFTHSHADTSDDESAIPSIAEYFFDRLMAYDGVVVLAVQEHRHVDWVEEAMDLVVRVEE